MSTSNYNSINNNIINNHNLGIHSNNPLSNLSNDKKGNNISSINNMTDSSYNYEINNSSINQDNKQHLKWQLVIIFFLIFVLHQVMLDFSICLDIFVKVFFEKHYNF